MFGVALLTSHVSDDAQMRDMTHDILYDIVRNFNSTNHVLPHD